MNLKLFVSLEDAEDAEIFVRIDKLAADGRVIKFHGVLGDPQGPCAQGAFRLSHHVSRQAYCTCTTSQRAGLTYEELGVPRFLIRCVAMHAGKTTRVALCSRSIHTPMVAWVSMPSKDLLR